MAAEEIPVSAYASKLLNRADTAEGTMAFQFEKPPGFDFKSGQSIDLRNRFLVDSATLPAIDVRMALAGNSPNES